MRKECSMQLNRSLMARRWGLLRDHPQLIHEDLPCSLRGEDLPSIMEDNCGLAKTGPGMLASIDADQMIFSFQALLDQAHIVLLLEWSQRQDSAEDSSRFDANEHRRMHTAGNRRPIGSDDIQIHCVLIDLGQQGRSRNGERKRGGRLAFTW